MIKEILKEFDEKFLTNPTKKIAYINGDEKRELSKFLSDKINEAIIESVICVKKIKRSIKK